MVLDKAEDALVVVSCPLWTKSDDNALACVRFNNALSQRNRKEIVLVGEELERGRQIAIIHDVEQPVGRLL